MKIKNYYAPGAYHDDHHKELNICFPKKDFLSDIIGQFLKEDAEDIDYEEVTDVNGKEELRPSDFGGKSFEFVPKAIEKCFKFQSDFLINKVKVVLNDYYHGNNANLALIEITLFHHQQLKKRNAHTCFVMSLAIWGIIPVSSKEDFDKIVYGVADKYKRVTKEGYKEWDDFYKEDRLVCERIGEKLGPTMSYQP